MQPTCWTVHSGLSSNLFLRNLIAMKTPSQAPEIAAARTEPVVAQCMEAESTTVPVAPAEHETPTSDGSSQQDRIRRAAYAAAEQRGFTPGFELDDWLEAEKQVLGAAVQGDAGTSPRPSGESEGNP